MDDSGDFFSLETIHSRVEELSELRRSCKGIWEQSSDESKEFLNECYSDLKNNIDQFESDFFGIDFAGIDVTEACLEHLNEELNLKKSESTRISNEVDVLIGTFIQESAHLGVELDELNSLLESCCFQGVSKLQGPKSMECPSQGKSQDNPMLANENHNFEVLTLEHKTQNYKTILRSLLNLDSMVERLEAIQQVEDLLFGVKVIEFEKNCIRLSLKTSIPTSWDSLCFIESCVTPHELLIELDGMFELKGVEIFPNDVYICDIVNTAWSQRNSAFSAPMLDLSNPLEWLVRRVQQRILLCTQRRLFLKDLNTSRYLFRYLDKEDIITAQLMGNIHAYIKVPQNWPLSSCSLKLISIKFSDSHSLENSLGFLCRVEELANSLDVERRNHLLRFVEAIEEILKQQMCMEFKSNHSTGS
ncbi:uncharacterized protein LOC105420020 isoform X1 [Amborella trichopoda]|uniref:uncharacterized protein LOC105420020 isoform X1 n=1 Tax=Amborella trichopoda TaxID=13333 RepID=UPI0005D38234|nr:uncharacterized protein LOC105420020 isoform X1 [Amborella trichopoda]|eukprot:XP_011620345.1 uncharacterized protein LOC105420020 isoform X1 [Amborella trichopoda]